MEPRTRFTMSLLLTFAIALTFVPAVDARPIGDGVCPHGGVYSDVVSVTFHQPPEGGCRVKVTCGLDQVWAGCR